VVDVFQGPRRAIGSLERLQEFDFEKVHRKGQSHKKCRWIIEFCEANSCAYCAKVERKSMEETGKVVARIVLEGEDLEEWREAQRRDSSVSFILQGKETGERPLHSEVPVGDDSAQIYWSYWDSLLLKDGVLYKKWEAPNLKTSFLQLIVPRDRVKEILEEAHDSPSGGHFGVNKTGKDPKEILLG